MTALPTPAPSTFAMPEVAAVIPSAKPRFSGGAEEPISAFARGMTPHAPTAWSTRPARSTANPEFAPKREEPATAPLRPHSTAPRQNTAMHIRNTGFLPMRSAALAKTGMNAA